MGVKQDIKFYNLIFIGLMFSLLFFLISCTENATPKKITFLRIAILPDQNKDNLQKKYAPLLNHIHAQTKLENELLIPDSYQQLLDWFIAGKVDLALLGGVTYVNAHINIQAVPLVMREIDTKFTSVALIKSTHLATSLKELEGVSLSFGSKLSTSGHLMPRHFLSQQDIVPELFFSSVMYSGAHDITAELVRDGKVTVGIANTRIVDEMFDDGRLKKNEVKRIWQSPPYADYVWAIQKSIDTKQVISIRNAFLSLNKTDAGKKILKSLGARYFIPSNHEKFEQLEQTIIQQKKMTQTNDK